MAERNTEREQWKKDFTDRVFDRLINPLTVMDLSLEKLKEVPFEGEQREYVQMVMENQAALYKAVTELRDAAGEPPSDTKTQTERIGGNR